MHVASAEQKPGKSFSTTDSDRQVKTDKSAETNSEAATTFIHTTHHHFITSDVPFINTTYKPVFTENN